MLAYAGILANRDVRRRIVCAGCALFRFLSDVTLRNFSGGGWVDIGRISRTVLDVTLKMAKNWPGDRDLVLGNLSRYAGSPDPQR